MFLKPNVEFVHKLLLIPQYLLQLCSIPMSVALLCVSIWKLLRETKHIRAESQSFALSSGLLICLVLFGCGFLVTEILSYNDHNLFIVNVKHMTINVIAVCSAIFPILMILISDYQDKKGLKRSKIISADWSSSIKFHLQLYAKICLFLLASFFLFQWVVICSFATILLSLAYPLHVLALIVLHIAFVFLVSITFAVFVSEIISISKSYMQKRSTRK